MPLPSAAQAAEYVAFTRLPRKTQLVKVTTVVAFVPDTRAPLPLVFPARSVPFVRKMQSDTRMSPAPVLTRPQFTPLMKRIRSTSTAAALLIDRPSQASLPSMTERCPSGRSAGEFSTPVKPPRIQIGYEIVADEPVWSLVHASHTSVFELSCIDASAVLMSGKASVQLVPSILQSAPSRTWMTFGPPPLP